MNRHTAMERLLDAVIGYSQDCIGSDEYQKEREELAEAFDFIRSHMINPESPAVDLVTVSASPDAEIESGPLYRILTSYMKDPTSEMPGWTVQINGFDGQIVDLDTSSVHPDKAAVVLDLYEEEGQRRFEFHEIRSFHVY